MGGLTPFHQAPPEAQMSRDRQGAVAVSQESPIRLSTPFARPTSAASQEPVDLRGCGVHDLLQVAVHGFDHILDGLAAGWLFALEVVVPNAAVGLGVD